MLMHSPLYALIPVATVYTGICMKDTSHTQFEIYMGDQSWMWCGLKGEVYL